MTIVNVWHVNDSNAIKKIVVTGHSDYARTGYDIVCSAVSTAMVLTANLIEKICSKYNIYRDEENISIEIEIIEGNDTTILVMQNLYEALIDISAQYPKYLKIKEL